jgi:hypothetical protein
VEDWSGKQAGVAVGCGRGSEVAGRQSRGVVRRNHDARDDDSGWPAAPWRVGNHPPLGQRDNPQI